MQFGIMPLRGRDAVEAFTVIVRSMAPIDDATFQRITAHVRDKAAAVLDLPGERPVQEIAFRFPVGFEPPQQFPSSGIVFQRFSKRGDVEAELRLEGSAVALTLHQYPGWKVFEEVMAPHLGLISAEYFQAGGGFNSVSMQFQNRFIAMDHEPGSPVNWQDSVLAPSPWVAFEFAQGSSYWHNHSGVFEPTDFGARRLINVNVDVQDFVLQSKPMPSLSLMVLASDQFAVEGFVAPDLAAGAAPSYLQECLADLHGRIKDLLRQTLSPECKDALRFDEAAG